MKSKEGWAPQDFGKPNIGAFGPESKAWHTKLVEATHQKYAGGHRILVRMKVDKEDEERSAPPESSMLEITLPDDAAVMKLRLQSRGKPANLLPESMWLTFRPQLSDETADTWRFDKVGQELRPSDVVRGGGRSMHAISESIRRVDGRDTFELRTLDAPVIALGRRSQLNFSPDAPDLRSGVHVNLYNNAWGTNYPQWCGGDWTYQFEVRG